MRIVEQPLPQRQLFARARGHQHDVDNPLTDDRANLIAVLAQCLVLQLGIVSLRRKSRRTDAERHVGILGIGEDEVGTPLRVVMNGSQLAIEGFLHRFSVTAMRQRVGEQAGWVACESCPNHSPQDTRPSAGRTGQTGQLRSELPVTAGHHSGQPGDTGRSCPVVATSRATGLHPGESARPVRQSCRHRHKWSVR